MHIAVEIECTDHAVIKRCPQCATLPYQVWLKRDGAFSHVDHYDATEQDARGFVHDWVNRMAWKKQPQTTRRR